MKRTDSLEMTYISGADNPEPENTREGTIRDKISSFVVSYVPEIFYITLILCAIKFLINLYFKTSGTSVVSGFVILMMILITVLYFELRPIYVCGLQRWTVFEAMTSHNFVFITMNDGEVSGIICADEDKFGIEPAPEAEEAFKVEKLK